MLANNAYKFQNIWLKKQSVKPYEKDYYPKNNDENYSTYILTHKKTLNKFRLGIHRISIETGRHTIPKTPENLRICSSCDLPEMENELHFILYCHLYDRERSNFFENINEKYPHFIHLSNDEKLFSYLTL